jgi:hypothetical protein
MIGLEYIIKINNTTFKSVGDLLNIRKQNAQLWCSNDRKIPKKYLPILSQEFEIPIEYLQKELTDIDKLKLQKIKLVNQCNKLNLKLEEL